MHLLNQIYLTLTTLYCSKLLSLINQKKVKIKKQAIFAEVSEKEFIRGRYQLLKAIIWSVLHYICVKYRWIPSLPRQRRRHSIWYARECKNSTSGKLCKIGCQLVLFTNRKSHVGFWLVPESLTVNGVMTADPRYICSSWASYFLCQGG